MWKTKTNIEAATLGDIQPQVKYGEHMCVELGQKRDERPTLNIQGMDSFAVLNIISFVLFLYLCMLLKTLSVFCLRNVSLVVYSFYSSMPNSTSILCMSVCVNKITTGLQKFMRQGKGIIEGFLAKAKCWLCVLCVCLLTCILKTVSVCCLLGTRQGTRNTEADKTNTVSIFTKPREEKEQLNRQS